MKCLKGVSAKLLKVSSNEQVSDSTAYLVQIWTADSSVDVKGRFEASIGRGVKFNDEDLLVL